MLKSFTWLASVSRTVKLSLSVCLVDFFLNNVLTRYTLQWPLAEIQSHRKPWPARIPIPHSACIYTFLCSETDHIWKPGVHGLSVWRSSGSASLPSTCQSPSSRRRLPAKEAHVGRFCPWSNLIATSSSWPEASMWTLNEELCLSIQLHFNHSRSVTKCSHHFWLHKVGGAGWTMSHLTAGLHGLFFAWTSNTSGVSNPFQTGNT